MVRNIITTELISLCAEYGLSVLDEDKFYKRTYTTSISNDEYYKTLKEDLDNVISYSVTLKQLFERMRSLGYKVYSRNGVITIYRDGKDKVRIENVFGEEYSKERINQRLYLSRLKLITTIKEYMDCFYTIVIY